MIFHPSLKQITGYLDSNLSDTVRKKVQGHVEHCEKCNKNIQLLRTSEQLLEVPKVKFDSITKNVMEKIQDRKWNTSREFVGEIKSVIGKTVIQSGTKGENLEVFPGCALRKGTTLLTDGESKALVEWRDGSQICINEKTELDFQTSLYPLTLRLGEIFSMIKPQEERFEIQTPSAVLSVIGTDFDTEVNKEKQTSLKVLKGKVGFKNKAGEVLVKKNQQVEASEYTKPEVTKIKETQTIKQWTTSINPNRTKGEIMKKVFIALAVIIVLIGGYWIYQNSQVSPVASTPAPVPTEISGTGKWLVSKEPKMVDMGELKLIGMETTTTFKNELKDGTTLWGDFMKRGNEINGKTGNIGIYDVHEYYSDYTNFNEETPFAIIASLEVNNVDSVPPGMVSKTLPAARYAVFTHKGTLTTFQDSYLYIYRDWFPKSGYKVNKSEYFEYFNPQRFKGMTDLNSEVDIYIPVEQ
jgi:predicted transcriptional regulator YdeE